MARSAKVKQLVAEVARLSPEERIEFEREWDALQLRHLLGRAWDEEAAEAAARFRLPPDRERRLRELLRLQEEGRLTVAEEEELDALLAELDRRTQDAAQALQELAQARRGSRNGK